MLAAENAAERVTTERVRVFWQPGCSSCLRTKEFLSNNGVDYESTRLTTNCHGRNAWRWKSFRCSDAVTTATFDDGTEYTGVTIAACALTQQELANPIPEEPDDPEAEDDNGDGGDSEDSDGEQSDAAPALLPGLHR